MGASKSLLVVVLCFLLAVAPEAAPEKANMMEVPISSNGKSSQMACPLTLCFPYCLKAGLSKACCGYKCGCVVGNDQITCIDRSACYPNCVASGKTNLLCACKCRCVVAAEEPEKTPTEVLAANI